MTTNTAYIGSFAPTLDSYDTTSFAHLNSLGTPTTPTKLALSPDNTIVYVLEGNTGTVAKVDAAALTLISSVTLAGSSFFDIRASPDGLRVYVSSRGTNTIYVLDASTLATITTWSVPNDPVGIAVSPDSLTVYVSEEIANSVVAIHAGTGAIFNTVVVGNDPVYMALSSNGLTLYVCNFLDSTVSVINTGSFTVSTTITMPGGFPFAFVPVLSPDNKYLYVTEGNSPVAWQITTSSNTVTDTLTLVEPSQGLAITPDSGEVWIAEQTGSNQIQIFSIPSDTLIHSISYSSSPTDIVITPPPPTPPPPPPGTVAIPPLFIPRKTSLDPLDLDIDWLAIERWANALNP